MVPSARRWQEKLCRWEVLRWALLLFITLVLAGCGGKLDTTVTFYQDEQWDAQLMMTVPKQLAGLPGSQSEVEKQLQDTINQLRAQGMRVSWSRKDSGSDVVYTITAQGEGLDNLSQAVFEGQADITLDESSGEPHILFAYYQSPTLLQMAERTLTLKAGKIISSNGWEPDAHTVTWHNPSGGLEAVLTPASRFNPLPIVAGVAGAIVLAGGTWWLLSRRRGRGAAVSIFAVCPGCGFHIPPGATYCPSCGRPR